MYKQPLGEIFVFFKTKNHLEHDFMMKMVRYKGYFSKPIPGLYTLVMGSSCLYKIFLHTDNYHLRIKAKKTLFFLDVLSFCVH